MLFVPRTEVWDFLAPTIRPYFSVDTFHPITGQAFRHCDDKALVTLASHFLNNVKTSRESTRGGLFPRAGDTLDLKNAINAIQLISEAPPSSFDLIGVDVLLEALTLSFTTRNRRLFNSVCLWAGHWVGSDETMLHLIGFVEGLVPVLTTGAAFPNLVESFAVEW